VQHLPVVTVHGGFSRPPGAELSDFLLAEAQYLKSLNKLIDVLLFNESLVFVIGYDKNTRQTRSSHDDIIADEYRTVCVVSHVSPVWPRILGFLQLFDHSLATWTRIPLPLSGRLCIQ
jgi:hypothetical protein